MARVVAFRRTLRDELRDPEFAAEYAAELQRLRIAHQITEARQAQGLTQADLARRMGTAQPTVARLERGDYRGYTVSTLVKAAQALKCRLRVEFEPVRPSIAYGKKMVSIGNGKRMVKRGAKKK